MCISGPISGPLTPPFYSLCFEGQAECLYQFKGLKFNGDAGIHTYQNNPTAFTLFFSCFFFFSSSWHAVVTFDDYLTNFHHVAPTVLATDWPPTAVQLYHSNSCRRLFWSGRAFLYRSSQNNHSTAGYILALTYTARQDFFSFKFPVCSY